MPSEFLMKKTNCFDKTAFSNLLNSVLAACTHIE